MLFTLLNIVIPVVGLAGVGFLLGRRHSGRQDMAFINHANVTVFCPALVFSALMANPVSLGDGWPLVAGGVLIVVVPGLLLYWLTPKGISRQAFLVTGMFRNTGNVGIPLMVLAYGNDLLGDIVLLFVLSNLLHFSLGLFIYAGFCDDECGIFHTPFGRKDDYHTRFRQRFHVVSVSAGCVYLKQIHRAQCSIHICRRTVR